MLERRSEHRNRVYYGGVVAFNTRQSSMDCIVRNFTWAGAKIELFNNASIPDDVDFTINQKGVSFLARVVWRNADFAGLRLGTPVTGDGVIPLEFARRIKTAERARKDLQAKIDRLTTPL